MNVTELPRADGLEGFDIKTETRIGSPDWTVVCPVCRALTAERVLGCLYCHVCDWRQVLEGDE